MVALLLKEMARLHARSMLSRAGSNNNAGKASLAQLQAQSSSLLLDASSVCAFSAVADGLRQVFLLRHMGRMQEDERRPT